MHCKNKKPVALDNGSESFSRCEAKVNISHTLVSKPKEISLMQGNDRMLMMILSPDPALIPSSIPASDVPVGKKAQFNDKCEH